SLATALSLIAWYVFAPQCLSTLAVVKRETNSWRYPLIMAGYLFALAYLASFITYHVAVALGGGWPGAARARADRRAAGHRERGVRSLATDAGAHETARARWGEAD